MEIIYWLIVIFGYLISLYFLFFSFVIAISFFNQVPFVPLERKAIRYSISQLDLKPLDRFLDIGSGDGRVVRYAAIHYPQTSVAGIEYSSLLNTLAKLQSIFYRNAKLTTADAFKFSYKGYNKIFIYLTSDMISDLLPKVLKEADSDAIIVSSYFKPLSDIDGVNVKEKKCRINGKIKSFFVITKNGNQYS